MSVDKTEVTKIISKYNAKLHGYFFEDLKEGMKASYTKIINDADVKVFSNVSGDTNPLHLNNNFARDSLFKGKVVHGMLTASLISTVIGTKLPGPGCIYIEQNLKFKAPVKIGDSVTALCEIIGIISNQHMIKMNTTCTVASRVVIAGEATILVPKRTSVVGD